MIMILWCSKNVIFSLTNQQHNHAKYDKSITLFSPEGDLLQVAYAQMACEKGEPLVCTISMGGILLCYKSQPSDALLDRRAVDKVSQIDDNIWLTFAGLGGDGRAMVRLGRSFCGDFRTKFGCAPSVMSLARAIGELQHGATLKGGERPFGIHVLVCGYDENSSKPVVCTIKASGEVSQWKATAIGRKRESLCRTLENVFRDDWTLKEAANYVCDILRSQTNDGNNNYCDNDKLKLKDETDDAVIDSDKFDLYVFGPKTSSANENARCQSYFSVSDASCLDEVSSNNG